MNKTEQNKPKRCSTRDRQSRLLACLGEKGIQYNVTLACHHVGIGRTTFYDWMNTDTEFRAKYETAREERLDMIEQSLYKNIMSGDAACTIFALKTLGKERGYVEKDSVNRKVAALLEDVLADRITVREAAFKINAMGQPLPEILKIELAKVPPEDPNTGEGVSVEELERKAKAAMEAVMNQRDHFVPQRQEEVRTLKQNLDGVDAFNTKQADKITA